MSTSWKIRRYLLNGKCGKDISDGPGRISVIRTRASGGMEDIKRTRKALEKELSKAEKEDPGRNRSLFMSHYSHALYRKQRNWNLKFLSCYW